MDVLDFVSLATRMVYEHAPRGPSARAGRRTESNLPRLTQPWMAPSIYKGGLVLGKTSVIVCFYNEEFFALMRTVWSVLMTSPPELVEEVGCPAAPHWSRLPHVAA